MGPARVAADTEVAMAVWSWAEWGLGDWALGRVQDILVHAPWLVCGEGIIPYEHVASACPAGIQAHPSLLLSWVAPLRRSKDPFFPSLT